MGPCAFGCGRGGKSGKIKSGTTMGAQRTCALLSCSTRSGNGESAKVSRKDSDTCRAIAEEDHSKGRLSQ